MADFPLIEQITDAPIKDQALTRGLSAALVKRPDRLRKLEILAESARYDVSCSSSGSTGFRPDTRFGSAAPGGICHSWSADGRCISLLKILLSNVCINDCAYCVNRRSNDIRRVTFSVDEMVDLTLNLYRRKYIEGLFLSSGIWRNADWTMECLARVAEELRFKHGFGGYIHLKVIPGADSRLIARAGLVADRLSVNIELPTEKSLLNLAPDKSKHKILTPMRQISEIIMESREERRRYSSAPRVSPAGQSTQLVIGASPESDHQVLQLAEALYRRYGLKRVYYSGYVPVNMDSRLPALEQPPALREHRLYQADWLIRLYGFQASELFDERHENLEEPLDPKTCWALRHPHFFPVEVNQAGYEWLLRVPGIGLNSARRICSSRRFGVLRYEDLGKIGVAMRRARFFLTVNGRYYGGRTWEPQTVGVNLLTTSTGLPPRQAKSLPWRQLELF
jgi:putative DNA modification/repair radical SAM protein